MLILQDLSYRLPNEDVLFEHLNLSLNRQDKLALIGNNGCGKSTLLKIMAGLLKPSDGNVFREGKLYYHPQLYGQFQGKTIADALQIEAQLKAFHEILNGFATEANLNLLNDDWGLEERCREAMIYWGLEEVDLNMPMGSLSGGQQARVFLAGIFIHQPELILMDEPSNHLDMAGRALLFDFLENTNASLVIVSHDRRLLNIPDRVCELSKGGLSLYGGNYDFYAEQKAMENETLLEDLRNREKLLRKAREAEKQSLERHQKLSMRGRKKQEKAGMPKIMLNMMKNKAENSSTKLKEVHAEKVASLSRELGAIRSSLPDIDKMQFGLNHSQLHIGKVLVRVEQLNHQYGEDLLWQEALNFEIASGDRIVLNGLNGSGKTTLINIILGLLNPGFGKIYRAVTKAVYVDQEYSQIQNHLNVYEQAQYFNHSGRLEHEVKTILNRFLFPIDFWDKPCSVLSGGEKMRLLLCCLSLSQEAPDLIVLDEPTNNLDIRNIDILSSAIKEYKGTLIVASHDSVFLEDRNLTREILLKRKDQGKKESGI